MIRMLLFSISFLQLGNSLAFGDSWAPPHPIDYYSPSEEVVAHVTPAGNGNKATVEVSRVNGEERSPLWKTELSNIVAPTHVFVTNDAAHLVAIDNWGENGRGQEAVAIFDSKGPVARYSLHEVFDWLLRDEEENSMLSLEARSQEIMGRWGWYGKSFLDDDAPILFIWLDWAVHWLAWDLKTGAPLEITEDLRERAQKKHRSMILDRIEEERWPIDLLFLGRMKREEDKGLIRSMLKDPDFFTGHTSSYENKESVLKECVAYSALRLYAEYTLAKWDTLGWAYDRETTGSLSPEDVEFQYLGSLQFEVQFDGIMNRQLGDLIIYLQPLAKDNEALTPTPFLHLRSGSYSPRIKERLPVEFHGLTPGKYQVRLILDTTAPLCGRKPPFTASEGDTVELESPEITIEAGKTSEGPTIQCRRNI